MKRMTSKLLAVLCVAAMMCTMFAVSASAISGGGKGSGSIHEWGCDMSFYNTNGDTNYGLVDYAKMKADGCDFVILRIGYEGSQSRANTLDKSFVKLYNMAREAGMHVGLYFYSLTTTYNGAVEDAQWVISVIESNNMYFEYPIYYDVEDSAQTSLGSSAMTNLCLGWCETLEKAGYFPGIYGGMTQVMDKLSSDFLSRYDTWIAMVKSSTTGAQYNPWSDLTSFRSNYGMWQYKWYNQGGTQVYNGATWKDQYGYPLDCNVAFKDYPSIMQTYGYNNMVTKHKITFETNGGTAVDAVQVTDGQALTEPTAPTKYAFQFAGWYCDPALTDPYDFSSPVPYDFTLYAKWEEAYWGANTNLMPNSQQLQLNDYNGQGAIWPYWNDDANNSVTFYNGVTNDDDWSWPSAYMSYEHSFDSVGDTYLYIKKDGNSYFNVILTYLDKNGEAHDLYLSDIANLTETDFAPGYLEEFYNVGSYIRNLGHAPASGNVKFTKVTYFIIGVKDSYTRLYDLKFTQKFEIESAQTTLYNKDVEQIGGTGSYVYDDGVLTMEAKTDAGYSVKFTPNATFKPAEFVNLLMDLSATAPFNVSMVVTSDNGDLTMDFRNEYFDVFGLTGVPEALPAGNYVVGMNLYGYYDWNGGIPAESTVKSVTISLAGKGTLTLKALQASRAGAISYIADGERSSGSLSGQDSEEKMLGDVNGDNKLSTVDVRMLVLQTVAGNVLTPEQLEVADYNGDGAVNTQDARAILLSFVA